MKQKFVVDKITLGKTTECTSDFDCLDEAYPKFAEVMQGVDSVLCRFEKDHFCHYSYEIVKRSPACMCHVRNEIFRKYR